MSSDLAAELGSAPRAIHRLTRGRNRKMSRPAGQRRMSVEETLLRVFKPKSHVDVTRSALEVGYADCDSLQCP